MLDKVVQAIQSTNTLLILIPSDEDWAAIFVGLALVSALPNKQISVLNDEITTNQILTKKVSQYRFNSIRTKATQLYSIVINKKDLKITQSFFDESEDKLTLSFETSLADMGRVDLFELQKPQLNQDLVLVVKSNSYNPSPKYQKILAMFATDKVVNLEVEEGNKHSQILALEALKTIQTFAEVSLDVWELLLISLLKQTDCLTNVSDPAAFDFIKQAIEQGIDYQKCVNLAKNTLEQSDLNLTGQSLTNLKDAGNGIYYSIINDPYETFTLNTNITPYFANLYDCHVAFIILARNKYCHVFILNQSPQHSLVPIQQKFNAQGNDSHLYFKTKTPVLDLEKEILRLLIKPQSEVGEGQISLSVDMDLPSEQPRFTQGLGEGQPLIPALQDVPTTNTEAPISNPTPTRIIEEC